MLVEQLRRESSAEWLPKLWRNSGKEQPPNPATYANAPAAKNHFLL